MKKFGKILLGVVLALVMVIPFTVAGCDIGGATKDGIESATDLVPIEYSKELAKNVYLTAVGNSKRQKTIKFTIEYRNFGAGGPFIDSCNTTVAYWRNNDDKSTDYFAPGGGCATKIDGTYYYFDTVNHQYQDMTGEPFNQVTESMFGLVNDIYGGLCYGDAKSRIMAKDGELAYLSVNVKDSLIVGADYVQFNDDGLVAQVITVTYEYNLNLDDIFEGLPTSLEGWTPSAP